MLTDGAVSRDGRLLATVRGEAQTTRVLTYRVDGRVATDVPAAVPTPLCETSQEYGTGSPTFAPDSSAVAERGRRGCRRWS